MRRFALPFSLLLIAACSKSNPAPTNNAAPSATSGATSTPPPTSAGTPDKPNGFDAKAKLKDGKVVEYRSAVVYQYQGSPALHIVAGTDKVTCADVKSDDGPKLGAGQDRIEIVVAPVLRADGTSAHAVMQAFHFTSGGTESGALDKYADVRLAGEDPGKVVRATVSGWTSKNLALALEGTIAAEGCGAVKGPEQEDDAPKPRPQEKLSLEIGQKKLEVKGAVYWPNRNLLALSTRALGCSTTAIESEVDLYLSDDGSSARFGGFGVENVDTKDLEKGPKIELGKAEKEVVPAKINGKFDLGPYPVKVSGSAELLSCD